MNDMIENKQVFTNSANSTGVALITAGGGGGTWAYIDDAGNTVAAPGTEAFNAHPVFGGIRDVTIDGQLMVKIPKFYIKRGIIATGENTGKEGWWVSDQPIAGYAIHPAFRSAGVDVDQIYVGKYQASLNGEKLESKAGVPPAVSRSMTQFIAAADARNTAGVVGFGLWSVFHWSAIQWLYLVENATMDSQTKTGLGRVSAANVANVDAADVAQATYRGIVGLWGNVYQWMDGLKTVSGVVNLWDKNGNKTWVSTGQTPPNINGWTCPTTFMSATGAGFDMNDVFIASAGEETNSAATAPDVQYFNDYREYFPLVGGYWSNAADAGLWYVYCSPAASSVYTSFGARLAKV